MTIDVFMLVLMVGCALWAVMAPNLLKAAIGLAVTSAVLSIIMFRLNAPLAAVFELSVCAGLITVVFISVISLTRPAAEADGDGKKVLRRFAFLPLLVLIAAVAFGMLDLKPDFSSLPALAPEGGMRIVLWGQRQLDLFAQVVVLLAGIFGVVVLFKERHKG
jgi:NADH-quinone oxidoreductase subunit J